MSLRLEVAASDGHDALVGSVVHVACYGGPLGNTFDMVGHDPSMLKILAGLQTPNQVDPTTKADLGNGGFGKGWGGRGDTRGGVTKVETEGGGDGL